MALSAPIPTGTVTLLFTDIEGSTKRWEERRASMALASRRHDQLLRTAIESYGGHVFKTVGDGFCAAFWRASDAIAAATDAQRVLNAEDWGALDGLHVRMALHAGATEERDGDYFGPTVNRVARILATAHGGQVLVSGAVALLMRGAMPEQTELRDLGEHRLKDLVEPERLWQLVASGLPDAFPPLRSLDSLPNNLPRQLTPLIGRDHVLAEIEPLVYEHSLVTLVGTGGVGKTRAALQAGADLLDGSGDGVWFVELAPLADPGPVAGTIATALGVREQPDRPARETLLHYLKHKRLLLILDNCEHLIDEVAKLAEAILRNSPEVRLLATSREPLRIAGERVYRMPSLSVPSNAATNAQDAMQYGAVALFAQRATASDSNFVLNDENAAIVAEICRRLDGIALAIELAAARVNVLAPKQLAQKLDERFRVLTGGSRTALPRQQTMRALIDWSYDLLSPKEQKAFRRLAIFAGGWTLETAVAVCADDDSDDEAIEAWEVLDLLASLVDKSLVSAEPAGERKRYAMLESTREYARALLLERKEYDGVAAAHARALLQQVTNLEELRQTMDDRTWRTLAEPELDNWRAALEWTLQARKDVDLGQRLAGSLGSVWRVLAVPEGWRWTRAALETTDTTTPPIVLGDLKRVEAFLNTALLRYEAARESAEEALAQYELAGSAKGIANAQYLAGRSLVSLGRNSEAESKLQAALVTFRRLGANRLTGVTLGTLAMVREQEGDYTGARSLFTEASAIFTAANDIRDVAVVLEHLAGIAFDKGDVAEAIRLQREMVSISRELGDWPNLVDGLTDMDEYLRASGQNDEAKEHAREALVLATRERLEGHIVMALHHLAGGSIVQYAQNSGRTDNSNLRVAVQLLGYVDMCSERYGYQRSSGESKLYRETLQALYAALDESEIAKLRAEGATWTEERAVAEGLAL